ncbi:MAG: hypothetical protein KF773_36400 [Deltaproteobacteria bacterium]|nr:hypothetical protein [Deltaproteobacteria bacterium]
MGSLRRLGRNALILVIAGLAGIVLGDTLAALGVVIGDAPANAAPVLHNREGGATSGDAPAPRARVRVVELAVDGRVRVDGGVPLGDAAAIAAALRRAGGAPEMEVRVAPDAGVPWSAVVDTVDLVRRVTGGVVRLDSPPE